MIALLQVEIFGWRRWWFVCVRKVHSWLEIQWCKSNPFMGNFFKLFFSRFIFFFFIRTKYQLIILLIGSWILLIYKILAKISKTLTTIVQSYVKDKKFPLFGVHKFSYKFRFLDDDGGKLFAIVHVSAKFSYGLIRHCNSDPVMGNTFFFFIFFYLTKIPSKR